ncbi:MAG: molybdopterin molybdotransferase MoeA [Anaeromyxobacter sp.]|nr:molybdopterin molybdotransferase MoeA [Anaeromyxobacter sp.]MBL0276149.1 molybdopterin molybdotransferase MoeA [Anaeromyxobacter sp.]
MKRLLATRDAVLATLTALPPERVALAEAAGRYLAAEALAARAAPQETCSAMDGYAVRAADLAGAPAALPVRQVLYAGAAAAPLAPGEAARIFTGAPLPPGADAVVREEEVDAAEGLARFRRPASPGQNVRAAGEDVARGGLALEAGARLGPRQLALLEAVATGQVEVVRRPRVAILSTGDEVVSGRTPDSNGAAVAGLCLALGATVERRRVPDRLEALAAALDEALGACDAVVTIGGVSVGERDHVPAALEAAGAAIEIHGVPMKPGKPYLFARRGAHPAFGLPGSPSACLVAFEVFVRPALLALCGAGQRLRPELPLRLAEAASGRPGRARLVWARLEAGGRARPLGRDTAQVRGPALADLLLCLGADTGDLPEGAEVTAWLLGEGG